MTIECYYSACPFHSFNDKGANIVDEGPFCYEDECRVNLRYLKTIEKLRPDQANQSPQSIKSTGNLEDDNAKFDALEKEHLGDPDKKTGIYHPDVRGRDAHQGKAHPANVVHADEFTFDPVRRKFNPHDRVVITPPSLSKKLAHYSVRYEWRISDDGKTLSSTVYFDAMGHQDAMKQFFNIYNGSKPLVSLTIKKSRP